MKKVLVNCCALLLIVVVGCQKETLNFDETENSKQTEILAKGGENPTEDSNGNELVILYPNGTTEAEKALKRAEYNVQEYKQCACADPDLELWVFSKQESNDGGIEDKRATAKSDEEIEGAEFNPDIRIQEQQFIDFGGVGNVQDGILKRVEYNNGVTVAVLDTGVMHDYPEFTQRFLYNSSSNSCSDNGYQEEYGWNFVDQDNNPYDNHYGRHGTIVTKLIASKFEDAEVDYQILPVKVADRNGNIRYFDALCGFQYAANKSDVDIINMSFGWNYHDRELLQLFIEEADDILVVTSAGNKEQNNDVIPHFPSSYESNNILAVAALAGNSSYGNNPDPLAQDSFANPFPSGGSNGNSALANFSNRGIVSVDIAAPGQNLTFMYNNIPIAISGTSYSAALTAGYGGVLSVDTPMSGVMLKDLIIQNSIFNPGLSEIKYSKQIP
jgi:hypothetical protein